MSFAPNPLYPVVTKPKQKNVALCRRHTDQPSIQPTKKPRNHPSLLSIQPSIALCSPVSAHSLPVASLAAVLHLPNVELPREPGVFELTGPFQLIQSCKLPTTVVKHHFAGTETALPFLGGCFCLRLPTFAQPACMSFCCVSRAAKAARSLRCRCCSSWQVKPTKVTIYKFCHSLSSTEIVNCKCSSNACDLMPLLLRFFGIELVPTPTPNARPFAASEKQPGPTEGF